MINLSVFLRAFLLTVKTVSKKIKRGDTISFATNMSPLTGFFLSLLISVDGNNLI